MNKKRVIINIVAPLCGVAAFIGVWFAVAASVGKTVILPTPIETLKAFFSLLSQSEFYRSVGMTLARTLLSFIIAFSLACLFAVLSYLCYFFKRAFSPITLMMRVMPTISIILLVFIWFDSEISPYVITFFVIFPMLYTVVANAFDGVDRGLLEMAKAYRIPLCRKIFRLYIPQMAPSVLTGISISLPFSVKLTIAAEVLAFTKESMGRNLKQQSSYLETPSLLAWTLAAILLGFLLEGLILILKKCLFNTKKEGKYADK